MEQAKQYQIAQEINNLSKKIMDLIESKNNEMGNAGPAIDEIIECYQTALENLTRNLTK